MTELALPLTLVGGMVAQAVGLAWWLRGRIDRLATAAEVSDLRHQLNNVKTIVFFLAQGHPELEMHLQKMISPGEPKR